MKEPLSLCQKKKKKCSLYLQNKNTEFLVFLSARVHKSERLQLVEA